MLYSSVFSGTEALRGTVMLHGDTLCSMELFIKPTKAQTSIKASFRSDKQWKLQQVSISFMFGICIVYISAVA